MQFGLRRCSNIIIIIIITLFINVYSFVHSIKIALHGQENLDVYRYAVSAVFNIVIDCTRN
jgi:hypothetical protein